MNNENFKFYKKPALQPMRPYVEGEDLTGVSVSEQDTPEIGGMIAINPQNEKDQWYVAKQFFEDNYVEDVQELKATEVSGCYVPSLQEKRLQLISMFTHQGKEIDINEIEKLFNWVENGSSSETTTFMERLVIEQTELREKYIKLTAFFDTDTFKGLPTPEQDILREQSEYMLKYVTVLDLRVSGSF